MINDSQNSRRRIIEALRRRDIINLLRRRSNQIAYEEHHGTWLPGFLLRCLTPQQRRQELIAHQQWSRENDQG